MDKRNKRYTLFKFLGEDYSYEDDYDFLDNWQVEYCFNSLELMGAGLITGLYMIYDFKEKKRIILFKVRDSLKTYKPSEGKNE